MVGNKARPSYIIDSIRNGLDEYLQIWILDDAKHFVGWCEFYEPQQYPFEYVGFRSSTTTYIEQ